MDQRLFRAGVAGDIDALHHLLQENPFVLGDYALATVPENPLNIAAKAGQLRFVREIIKIKPELAKQLSQDGFRPLDVASAYGHIEIARELLATSDSGICRLPGRDGRTAIHYAAMNGRVEVLDELLKACPDSATDVTFFGETALHLAVKYFKFDAFKALMEWLGKISLEEMVNWKDREGNTVLHCAVSRKQLGTVEYMLHKDNPIRGIIEVNAINTKGLTPMDMLDILIESSSDIQLRKILQDAGGQEAPEVQIAPPIGPQQRNSSTRSVLFHRERDLSANPRDLLLVAITLIATVTFQAGIDPPSHIFEVSNQPSYNISTAPTSNISWGLNSTASSLQNVVSDHENLVTVTVFLVANTIALTTAFSMMDYIREGLPFQRELRVSIFFMMFAYGWSLGNTKPRGSAVKDICLILALCVPLFIRGIPNLLKAICKCRSETTDQQ